MNEMTQSMKYPQMITKVLQSRRLLSEHIEILEDYLDLRHYEEPKGLPHRLRVPISATLGSLSLAGLSMRYSGDWRISMGTATAGLGLAALASCHWARQYKDWKVMRQLTELLNALDQYHSLLKRNLNYLTDLSSFGGAETLRDHILGTSCVDSTIRMIKQLHRIVSHLDEIAALPEELANYQPFEELGNCESLGGEEHGLKNFKALYTIFLYIQSQFVLRVVLALAEGQVTIDGEVKDVTRALYGEMSTNDLRIHRIKDSSSSSTIRRPMSSKAENLPGLRQLKLTATNVSTKLMLQGNQFDRFAEKLSAIPEDGPAAKTRSKLLELHEDLSTVESLFLSTACEFENVQLLLRKVLNIDAASAQQVQNSPSNEESSKEAAADSQTKVVDQSTAIDIDDEFFLLDGQLPEKDSTVAALLDDPLDDGRNERVLKTSFKPVLKQLRREIDPLHNEMLERERKFLQQQGVELPADMAQPHPAPPAAPFTSSTESEDEELDDNLILRRKKKFPPRYEENRKFLEEKVQTGGLMFRLPPPTATVTEDVLE